MAADDSDAVIAAAAYYCLKDECEVCDTMKRISRPRRFLIHDVISRRELKCYITRLINFDISLVACFRQDGLVPGCIVLRYGNRTQLL
jgi:rRNA maturation protein Nop10